MPLIILLLILGVPIIELMVMIEVGAEIGALSTVALTLLTAAAGIHLVRLQGLKVVSEMQASAARGEPVGGKLIHGAFIAIAGILLLFPGFITDFMGALLLIPPLRNVLGKGIVGHFAKKAKTAKFHYEGESDAHSTTVYYTSIDKDDNSSDGKS